MGLSTTHGCWFGPYSAFTRWRNRVAQIAGYEIRPFPGGFIDQPVLDWSKFEPKNYLGEWDALPEDPLLVLLVHADDDGKIRPEHAGPLADRLDGLLADLRPEGLNDDIRPATERFVAGLRAAVAEGKAVRFH